MSSVDGPDAGQLPGNLDETVALILQLYRPDSHGKVAKIQETLQKLQRSSFGWELAYSLREHPSEEVRFFAALTFTVKLNTDAKSLSPEDAVVLLQTLVTWLIRCVENLEKPLVMRKLCSTLVAYFFQFSATWERCIKHLMYCMCIKVAIPYVDLDREAPETMTLVTDILDTRAVAIFWFATSLVEEIGKTDSTSMKQHKFHQRVVPNVEDIIPLMSKYLNVDPQKPIEGPIRAEALKCFQAWVSYSHRAFIDDAIVLDPLRTLTKPAVMCLADDNLYETAIELFTEVLSNFSKFLSEDDFELLYTLFDSPWAQERYQRLIQGDFDFESIQFGLFTIAFGDANLQDLARKAATESRYENFLSALGGLFEAEGYAVHEDKIFVPALEFWSTFVENMIDDIYSVEGQHPPWFAAAQVHVNRAIDRCWRKLQFPPSEVFNSWDSVDRTGFKDARRDFGDLLQQFYLVSGLPLLEIFIKKAHTSIENKRWAELEVSLYCLSVFPDSVSEDPLRDEYLDQIFNASIFSLFANQDNGIPLRTVQSFILLINGFANYFSQNPTYLPNALNIVFEATASPVLSHRAASTILSLCSDCRKILLPELGAFLQQYQTFTMNSPITSVRESIMEGIASLIQAIPDDQSKITPLEQLLSFIDIDIDRCIQSMSSIQVPMTLKDPGLPDTDFSALDLGLSALRCLAGVGKGLQAPHDQPVDLEEKESGSTFWTSGPGSGVQQRIFNMVAKVFDVLGTEGDIVDAACYVWRQGFRELEPGPFVMRPSMVAEFLLKSTPQTPRLGCVIGTACSFVTSHKSGPGIDEVLEIVLNWVSQLLQAQGEPSNDPEVAQNGIDFLTRLLPKYLNALMSHQPSSLEFLFMFTLKAITGTDPLPKIAASDFWTTFIALSNQANEFQDSVDNVLRYLGPLLAKALIFNISGHAARSELDKLSEPLKKLVSVQPQSKSWIEGALSGESFTSTKVTPKDKTIFLQKITLLRGAKGTNQVVRDFWLACRGSNFAYAS
ncbi:armadillo-type protein [Tricladium varicosporioides]|nr:armadillo-type protein [Hymenoscyphus varicosporioides]